MITVRVEDHVLEMIDSGAQSCDPRHRARKFLPVRSVRPSYWSCRDTQENDMVGAAVFAGVTGRRRRLGSVLVVSVVAPSAGRRGGDVGDSRF
jgi:hypothetical protein